MQILITIRDIGPPNAYIAAGAIRNSVWNYLHHYPNNLNNTDIDVVYYDSTEMTQNQENNYQTLLNRHAPQFNWEVTNQALVHLWYEQYFNQPVIQLKTLLEIIATWPETATAIAIRLTLENDLDIIAPFGLEDLFNMIVRWSPNRASYDTFIKRINDKKFATTWCKVKIIYHT